MGFGGPGRWTELWRIVAGEHLDTHLSLMGGLVIVLRDALANLRDCDAHDWVRSGVIVRRTVEDVDAEKAFFEELAATFECLFNKKAKESGVPAAIAEVVGMAAVGAAGAVGMVAAGA